jgi:hypothetical protein
MAIGKTSALGILTMDISSAGKLLSAMEYNKKE